MEDKELNNTLPVERLTSNTSPALTVFYDGYCPLCVKEMLQLSEHDKHGALSLVDINSDSFSERFPDIDKQKASQVLHGKTREGEVLLGLDTTYRAWSLVDKHRWLACLRWPVIRVFADLVYLFFARNRYWISYLLTGKSRCETCLLSMDGERNSDRHKNSDKGSGG